MKPHVTPDSLEASATFTPGVNRPKVVVLGTRLGRFVEFEYSLDKDLAVELVMPFVAFDEFCAAQDAEVQAAGDLSVDDLRAFAARGPGLYRAPDQHPDQDDAS